MNCPEFETLLDAYLDGQLAGTLRLEFDAHRLNCRRCQQTVALLESAGHVIAADADVPDLPADFSARVMRDLAAPAPKTLRFPATRVAVFAAALAQIAAALLFVVLWQISTPPPAADRARDIAVQASPAADPTRPDRGTVYSSLVEGIEDHLWEMRAAGQQLTTDVLQLARYLDIRVPDEVVRESTRLAERNPWQALWDALQPGETQERSEDAGDEILSI